MPDRPQRGQPCPPLMRLQELLRQEAVQVGLLLAGAALLRLIALGTNPPGLFCDEVVIGNNAHSIGLTGKDLNGTLLPLYCHEKSFDEWNLRGIVYQPIYLYTEVPFVRMFGLSATVIRLPSVLFALLGILGTYLLGKELYGKAIGFMAAGLLSVSPWHFHFSRIAFEAISLPVFLIFGSLFLFRGLSRPQLLVLGAGCLALGTFAYPTGKLFAPVILLAFVAIHVRRLWTIRKWAGIAVALFAVLMIPHLHLFVARIHQDRLQDVLIFSGNLDRERAVQFLRHSGAWASGILSSRPLLVGFTFAYNTLLYFSPGYLFWNGDPNLRHHAQFMGMCYLACVPLLACGLAVLLQEWRAGRARFALVWLLCYPIPASLAIEAPHSIRTITSIPMFDIVSALGIARLWTLAKSSLESSARPWAHRAATAVLGGVLLLGPFEIVFYFRHYFAEYPRTSGAAWQAGVGEGIRRLASEKREGETAFVSSKVLNSHAFVLFYGGVDFSAIERGADVDRQLRPFGYRILFPGRTPSIRPGDLALLTASELASFSGMELVAPIPHPDGRPNLYVLRKPRP